MKGFLKLVSIISMLSMSGCGFITLASTATGVAAVHDRRTAGTFVDDQAIGIKAKMAIASNKVLWKNSHVDTMTFNKNVLVLGQTPNGNLKNQATKAVKSVNGVHNIYNQMTIGKPTSLRRRTLDSWITAQIKTKLLANPDIGPNRVKISTENAVVYMMGILTEEEERAAEDIAINAKGVKKVVKIFERPFNYDNSNRA